MVDFASLTLSADTRGLERGEIVLDRVAKAAGRTERAADGMSRGVKRGGENLNRYNRTAKASSFHTSNLLAQFNDIGVMMASGQSPLLLAAQQGTQVSQVLNSMGRDTNKLQALGAAFVQMVNPVSLVTLGVIAGGTALGQWGLAALGATKDARTLDDALEDLNSRLDSYSKAAVTGADHAEYIAEKFGAVTVETIALGKQMQDLRLAEIMLDAAEAVGELADSFSGGWRSELARLEDFLPQSWFDDNAEGAKAFARSLDQVRHAANLEDQLRATRELKEQMFDAFGNLEAMGEKQREFYRNLLETEGALSRAVGITTSATAETRNWESAMRGVRVEIDGILGSLASIGGGMISNAAKQAEIDALRAGGSIRDAAIASKRFEKELELSAKEGAATNIFEKLAVDAERYQFEQGLVLDDTLHAQRELAREREKEATKAAKAAKSASTSTVAALKQEIAQRQALLGVTGDMRDHMEAVFDVQRRLGKDASKYSKEQIDVWAQQLVGIENAEEAMRGLNGTAGQLSDTLTNAILDTDNIGDAFEDMWTQIRNTLLKNQIVVPIVGAFTGVAGLGGNASLAQSVLGLGGGGGAPGGILQTALGFSANSGGGGLLSPILGNLGSNLLTASPTLGTGFLGGLGSTLSSTFGSGGGLGGLFSIGANASAAGGGLLAAAGAAVPLLGAAVGVGSLLSKAFGKKYDGSGYAGRISATGLNGYGYDKYSGGWFRSDSEERTRLPSGLDAAVDQATRAAISPVFDAAGALGLSTRRARNYRGLFFKTGIKGTEEEKRAKIERTIGKAVDHMAKLTLGTLRYNRAGETSTQTIIRLSTHLQGVNDLFEQMDKLTFDIGLRGADAASDLVRRFGGMDQLTSQITGYYDQFFTEEERRANTLQFLTGEFADLGLTLPKTRDAFRQTVEGLDLMTSSGRHLYSELIQLSDAMAFAIPDQSNVTQLWTGVADSLRALLDDILNTNLTPASGSQVLAANRARFNNAFDLASAGDTEAAQQVAGYARTYLNSLRANAASEEAYRRSAGRVLAQISGLVDMAELSAGVIPGFAYGGHHAGGVRIVGENGPEAEFTGPARYYSHTQTKAMMSGGGSNHSLERKLDALVSEVAALRSENRQLRLKELQYSRKDSRVLQTWNTDGMPPERTV